MAESAAIQLLSHGDLLRPSVEPRLAAVDVRVPCHVLEPTRLAVLEYRSR